MYSPKVSVIIPAYNQAGFIIEAIQSVIDQTYPNWELIVVDDGSTDDTASVVKKIKDPRVQYLYQENKGLPGARNTGIRNTTAEYVAFLDSDDYYHPKKLELQMEYLEKNPAIGLCYSTRISVDQEGKPLRISRAPENVTVASFADGFPFTINDIMIRREWIDKINGFDESFRLHSEDRDFYIRITLKGCKLGRVDRPVAYRRVHEDRCFRDLPTRLETMFRAMDTLFEDPMCPPHVKAKRDQAYSKDYLIWAYQAAFQKDTSLAHSYFSKAIQLNPSLASDNGNKLQQYCILASIADGSEHEQKLRTVFSQLPGSLAELANSIDYVVSYGYLMRSAREVLWGRIPESWELLTRVDKKITHIDDFFIDYWGSQISNFEIEYGEQKTSMAIDGFFQLIEHVDSQQKAKIFKAQVLINRAFEMFGHRNYSKVPSMVINAVRNDPILLLNRGVHSIMVRSLFKSG